MISDAIDNFRLRMASLLLAILFLISLKTSKVSQVRSTKGLSPASPVGTEPSSQAGKLVSLCFPRKQLRGAWKGDLPKVPGGLFRLPLKGTLFWNISSSCFFRECCAGGFGLLRHESSNQSCWIVSTLGEPFLDLLLARAWIGRLTSCKTKEQRTSGVLSPDCIHSIRSTVYQLTGT